VELAQALLAIPTPIDSGLARQLVGRVLGREPDSLPEQFASDDLRPDGEFDVAAEPLPHADFVVVDLETTGLGPSASILEIGAVRISGLAIVDRFETLVRPPGRVPRAIVALTGIQDSMAAAAPTRRRALQAFRAWLDRTPTAPFVAHNAGFDHGFVRRDFEALGLAPYRGPVLCTRKLGRRLLPELGRYNLDHLCAHFGISNGARHRALGDADATARALLDLLPIARARFELYTLGDLIDFEARPPRPRKRRRRPGNQRRAGRPAGPARS
jgi:DNA polymerase-3 subunit epsilon